MATTHKEIATRRRELERERIQAMKELMKEFNSAHYAKMKALREECGVLGHKFNFSHFGPIGHPWSYCAYCGMSHVGEIDG